MERCDLIFADKVYTFPFKFSYIVRELKDGTYMIKIEKTKLKLWQSYLIDGKQVELLPTLKDNWKNENIKCKVDIKRQDDNVTFEFIKE